MSKVDLSRVKQLSPEEVKARLRRRIDKEDEQRRSRAPRKTGRPRLTVVKSVSILPELVIRVTRDIGEGSFSRGVVKAVTRYLLELDQEKAFRRDYE